MSPSNSETSSVASAPSPALSESVVKAIFLLLGVGILVPWNAFVSAKPYFQARLCSGEGQDIVDSELWFGLVWNLSSVFSLGLIIVGQYVYDYAKRHFATAEVPLDHSSDGSVSQASDSSSQAHSKDHSFWLVMVPLAIYMSVFVATDVLVLIPDVEPRTFLMITFVGLGLCGTCGAIASAGIVSTAGLFPSHVGINPFFSGQALGGVAVSVANFIAASMEDPASFWDQTCQHNETIETDERIEIRYLQNDSECTPYSDYDFAVFGYFLAGCIVLACCLLGYSTIHKYQESEHRNDYEVVHDHVPEPQSPSPRIGLEMKDRANERKGENEPESSYQSVTPDENAGAISDPLAEPPILPAEGLVVEEAMTDLDEYTDEESEVAVFWAIKGPATCIFLTFTVTLALFPSWISQLRSSHECQNHVRLFDDLYVPFNFVVFNVGDLVGRIMAEKVAVERIPKMSRKLVTAALLRVIFLPLLFLCTSENMGRNTLAIESDLYSFLVLFSFAFTNGILVSCSFMHGPHLVAHTTGMQERASEILTFAVYFGLLSGSMLSFPLSGLTSKL